MPARILKLFAVGGHSMHPVRSHSSLRLCHIQALSMYAYALTSWHGSIQFINLFVKNLVSLDIFCKLCILEADMVSLKPSGCKGENILAGYRAYFDLQGTVT